MSTILEGSDLTLEKITAECQAGMCYAKVYKENIVQHVYFSIRNGILHYRIMNLNELPFLEKNLEGVKKIEFPPVVQIISEENQKKEI